MNFIWSNTIVRPNLQIYEVGDRDAFCNRADRLATEYIIRVGQGYASIHPSTRGGVCVASECTLGYVGAFLKFSWCLNTQPKVWYRQ